MSSIAGQGETARKPEFKASSRPYGREDRKHNMHRLTSGKLVALCHGHLHPLQAQLQAQKETPVPNKGWSDLRAWQWGSQNNLCQLEKLLKPFPQPQTTGDQRFVFHS